MNKYINVSIAGIAFMLEPEGYQLLKEYLVKLEVGYQDNPDGGEIMSDIEARMAELILSEQSYETVVPTPLVKSIIKQLGIPDNINTKLEFDSTYDPDEDTDHYNLQKRLYRDGENAKIGGVCSGLAAYFHIEPVATRLLFLAPPVLIPVAGVLDFGDLVDFFAVLTGVSFMLYLILWFSIPKAKTPRQRLEMRGQRITADSIHQSMRDDFNDIDPTPRGERSASIFSELIYVIGRVLLFFIKALLLFIGIVVGLSALAVCTTVIAALFGADIFGGVALSAMSFTGITPTILVLSLGLLIVIPLIILCYLLLRSVFHLPSQKQATSIIFGIWIILLIYLGAITIRNFDTIQKLNDYGPCALDNEFYENIRHITPVNYDSIRMQDVDQNTRVEMLQLADSTVTDTVRTEYFTIE